MFINVEVEGHEAISLGVILTKGVRTPRFSSVNSLQNLNLNSPTSQFFYLFRNVKINQPSKR